MAKPVKKLKLRWGKRKDVVSDVYYTVQLPEGVGSAFVEGAEWDPKSHRFMSYDWLVEMELCGDGATSAEQAKQQCEKALERLTKALAKKFGYTLVPVEEQPSE